METSKTPWSSLFLTHKWTYSLNPQMTMLVSLVVPFNDKMNENIFFKNKTLKESRINRNFTNYFHILETFEGNVRLVNFCPILEIIPQLFLSCGLQRMYTLFWTDFSKKRLPILKKMKIFFQKYFSFPNALWDWKWVCSFVPVTGVKRIWWTNLLESRHEIFRQSQILKNSM